MLSAETIQQLSAHFEKNGLPISLPELQGIMLGYLCVQKEPCFQSWVALCDDLITWSDLNIDNQEQIKQLFLCAHMELRQDSPLSIVLAPASAAPTSVFWELVEWCRGFLYGVGLGGAPKSFYELPEIMELLQDFTTLTQIDLGTDHIISAQDLQDYQAILEHIHASLPLIYQKAQHESLS